MTPKPRDLMPVSPTKAGQYLEEPARLTWTAEKPTTPGLYGYRKSRAGKASVVEVELDGATLEGR